MNPEAVAGIDVVAVALVHFQRGRDHLLRRKHHRGDRSSRGDGAVIEILAQPSAARGVMAELALLAAVLLRGVLRAIAGGQAPHILAILLPLHRVGDGVFALGQRSRAAVEEISAAALAHVCVPDIAEVDPDVAVLVAEQRPEGQVFLALVNTPVVVVGARPHRPRIRADRVRGRPQGKDVDHHRLVVAHPVVVDEAALGNQPIEISGARCCSHGQSTFLYKVSAIWRISFSRRSSPS